MRTILIAAVVAGGAFITGAAAQHEGHGDPAAPAAASAASDSKMMMMGHMPQMMKDREETGKLVDRLAASFAAIEAEKDPAALKAKLAAHGALLKELQAKFQAESKHMDMMHQMMGGEQKK